MLLLTLPAYRYVAVRNERLSFLKDSFLTVWMERQETKCETQGVCTRYGPIFPEGGQYRRLEHF